MGLSHRFMAKFHSIIIAERNRVELNRVTPIDNKCKHNSRVPFTDFKDYFYSNHLRTALDRIIMVIKHMEA